MEQNLIFNQFEMGRKFLMMGAEHITEENADIIPEGFPNNLRWQLGHILVSVEYLVFHQAGEKMNLPEGYAEMFSRGTSPKDWTTEPPKVDVLKAQLSEQMGRVRATFDGRLDEKLPEPFKGGPFEFHTVGEMLLFALFHESEHIGCIKGLKAGIKSHVNA
ncbi:DinB family protein [Pseudalkalibacillus sp. SCS-8]|uniref:DinB family protein n=1 Tax=Pseudalkalibacillus nanhaiensis TaxID=3115291 RepID=UPI0032DB2388